MQDSGPCPGRQNCVASEDVVLQQEKNKGRCNNLSIRPQICILNVINVTSVLRSGKICDLPFNLFH